MISGLREDFDLPALVGPEFLRRDGRLRHLIPPAALACLDRMGAEAGLAPEAVEACLLERATQLPSAETSAAWHVAVHLFRATSSELLKHAPLTGSNYAFHKPLWPEMRKMLVACLAALETYGGPYRREWANAGRKSGVIFAQEIPDVPYHYELTYDRTVPAVPAKLKLCLRFHVWRDPISISYLTGDCSSENLYAEGDAEEILGRYFAYAHGIDAFLTARGGWGTAP